MSQQGISILTLSVVLLQVTPQGRLVTPLGALTDDPLAALGITAQAGDEGDCVSVTVSGTAPAETAAAFAKGAKLTTDEDGCFLTATGDAPVAALALQAASVAGLLVEVLIK